MLNSTEALGREMGACTGYDPCGQLVHAHSPKITKRTIFTIFSFISDVPINNTDFELHSVGVVDLKHDKSWEMKAKNMTIIIMTHTRRK